ncbi:SH3 domain-containing protein [Ravibacter arvi]
MTGQNLRGQEALHKADSLFAIGQYMAAQELYTSQLSASRHFLPNALLKMAYIAELNGDFTQSLYYLTVLSKQAPSEAVYRKMEAIALKNRLSGYKFDDLGYLVLYLKKYGLWLSLFMIAVTGYVLFELFIKYKKNEHITFVPKAIVVLSLLGLIVLLNIESLYNEGIVSNNPTFLRERPSSASAVTGTVGKGNKVVVLTSRDHWKLVLLKGKLVYIKRDDLLLI